MPVVIVGGAVLYGFSPELVAWPLCSFCAQFLCPQGGENAGEIFDLHFWQDSALSMPFGSGSGPGSHDVSPELSARQRLRLLA